MMKAMVLTAFSLIIVSGGFSFFTRNNCFYRFAAICMLVFSVSVIVGNKHVAFLLYAGLSMHVLRSQVDNVCHYYVLFLPLFPITVEWNIGLPGIDTLMVLNHNRVLILCLFVPFFLRILLSEKKLLDSMSSYTGVVDRLILLHLLIESVIRFRDESVLVAARQSLLLIVDIWLPYIVVSRTVKNVNSVLVVLLYTVVFLAVLSILERAFFIRIFDYISLPMGDIYRVMKIRGGELRTYASMSNPLALGLFFAVHFSIAVKIRSLIKCPVYVPWILAVLIILGVESTGSRSPLAANAFGIIVLLWWSMGRLFVQKTEKIVFICTGVFLVWLCLGGVEYVLQFDDAQGTFWYRYDLILNSMHLLKASPFFGTPPHIYLSDPILLQSMQGEGIIDLTNTYLLLMIRSGIFSMLSFLSIWIVLCKGLCHVKGDEGTASVLMACCIVMAVMLFICSPVTFVPVYYWFLIGLVVGFLRNHSAQQITVR
jgi:hypothetical protein